MAVVDRVPFFPYNRLFESEREDVEPVMLDVLQRGAFILQDDLRAFEEHLAEYVGARYAFGVADGTNAIMLALRAAGLRPGDEVILPSHTFVATAGAVVYAGGVPVVADCGKDHMLDATSIPPLITERTRGIVPVQLNGRTCDMDEIQKIADAHGLWIVEDAAQALGSRYRGRCAGTFGVAGTISFYPAKTLGCYGDGGAVITNDRTIAERISMLRDHGRGPDGDLHLWGTNSRLDNLQAAILDVKLKRYDGMITRRRDIAARYDARLRDISHIELPPAPDSDPQHFDIYQNYEIECEQRDELRAYLATRNIGTIVQWGGRAIHQWTHLNVRGRAPYTDTMFERCLLLPMNHLLSDEEVDYICDAIREFYSCR